MDYNSLNSTTTQSRVYSNRLCGNCEFTDGMCYTSNPPKRKCTITGEYHYYDHPCDVPIDKFPNINKPKVNYIDDPKLSNIKQGSITVKGFDSLLNLIKILVEGGYEISIKGSEPNKYNETTHLTVDFYIDNKSSNKGISDAYRDYLVKNTLTNSQANGETCLTYGIENNNIDKININDVVIDTAACNVTGTINLEDVSP